MPQSPDGTPQSIHNLASESVPDLVMVEPSRAGAGVSSGRFASLARDDDILDPTICNRVAHRHEEEPLTAVNPSSEDDVTRICVGHRISGESLMWWRRRLNHLSSSFRTSEAIRHAFVSLDAIDIEEDFQRRAVVMRSPPKILEGAHVSALRVARNPTWTPGQ